MWEDGVSHSRGVGFILPQQGGEEQSRVEAREQPVVTLPIGYDVYQTRLARKERRLTRRMDVIASCMDEMMAFNAQFSTTLSQAFASITSAPIQFPVYGNVPAYPQKDSTDDEEEDDNDSSGQGSPQF